MAQYNGWHGEPNEYHRRRGSGQGDGNRGGGQGRGGGYDGMGAGVFGARGQNDEGGRGQQRYGGQEGGHHGHGGYGGHHDDWHGDRRGRGGGRYSDRDGVGAGEYGGHRENDVGRNESYHGHDRYRGQGSDGRHGDRRGHAGRGRGHAGRGRGHGGSRPHPAGMQYISEEDLQTLSQGSPEDVLVCVNENESKFLNTFKMHRYCNHPMHLKRMVKLLYLLVKCEDQSTASKMLAQILCADGEYASYTIKIDQLLRSMSLETRVYIRKENLKFLDHLIDIGLMTIKTIPSTVVMTYPVTVMERAIEELAPVEENLALISRKFEEMNSVFKQAKLDAVKEAMKKMKPKPSNESEGEPPEPFTELSILPICEEIHMHSKKVFLRRNKTSGGYKDWAHYFDVQFRLLREDFVRPLREGIGVYCDTGSAKKTTDIRLYEGAKVLSPVCLFTGIGFQIRFDVSKLSRVNWEHSRRLIFGSLLCLSNDDFDKCFFFATVVKRDPKQLQQGLLTIKFENDVNGFQIDPAESYNMVESTAYYEAYRHVLKSMQDISEHPDAIPMKKYIMECDFTDVKIPVFLCLPSMLPHFNMLDILGKKGKNGRVLRKKVFNVSDESMWPQAEFTDLDESQLRALKMALTKEVSVIQGPPGTGKTYIGLKIVEAYLKNRAVWDPQKAAPILVVCYTNHALDQFLEGIQQLSIEDACPNIIRVGGRCKSADLENCVLNKKVQECRANRSIPRGLFRDFMDSRTALFDAQGFINKNLESCDAESKQKIISLSNLEGAIAPYHIEQLQFATQSAMGKEIEIWLELWFPEEEEEDSNLLPDFQEQATKEAAAALFPRDDEASSSDEEYIQVDSEARVLQDERMIEGEEVEVPVHMKKERKVKLPTRPRRPEGQQGWKTVQMSDSQRKKKISKGFNNAPMTGEEAAGVHDIWHLSSKQRWKLYLHWTNEYIKLCKERVNTKAQAYNFTCTLYSESQRNIDCFVAQGADVIGMTTTGAAKYHHLLKQIHPKIVIFEEAAEVLEAHVVTSMASSVQQLILIGDHKQLKPKPTCYDLEKNYLLAVSLFERLIMNNFEHVTLQKQHRMRPEISKLLYPTIYDTLQDAEKVKAYSHVLGVGKDLFFIEHTHPEESNDFNDTKSHVNKFEAEYIVELCHYLLKQGYSPYEITILTMYRGQLLELKKRMKREHFEGVRVAAVDDYQGEENEIILLSLVRSNSEESIGFLRIENRICVSLSRAKIGLYVIGNLHMLREKNDTKWPEIIHYLEKEKCIGSGLPLYCQVHPETKAVIRNPSQFRQHPEGGCTKMCEARLSCGHACERICHPKDRDHTSASCSKVCGKTLSCGHRCKVKCYQCKEKQKCMPCSELVEKCLPYCRHRVTVRCSADTAITSCPLPCEKFLSCGHKCQNTCSIACTLQCREKVEKLLPCGHSVSVFCFEDPNSLVCPVKCEKELECGDKCGGTCGKCQHGRLHLKCLQKCGRDLVCGHICKYGCASICPPCEEPCNNYCFHSKCPKKCYELCVPCMEPCKWVCPHFRCTQPCGQFCDRPPCNKPCKKTLKCGHPCIGLCGERCPKKCRVCDKDEVCEILFGDENEADALFIELQDCGHIIEVNALDQWMKTDNSGSDSQPSNSSSSSSQVQFKTCPRCKASIRKSVRYGNIIKQVLIDVEAIKRKQSETSDGLEVKLHTAKKDIKDLGIASYVYDNDLKLIKDRIQSTRSAMNWYRSTALKFQLSVLPRVVKVNQIISVSLKQISGISVSNCSQNYLEICLADLKTFIMQEFLSSQQISDGYFELRRLTCVAKLLDLVCKIRIKKCSITAAENDSIEREIERLYFSGWKYEGVTEDKEDSINKFIRELSTKYQVEGLSEEEKLQIVKAVGLSKGHWYKCQNGHVYCIGDCGGATVESKCPDCGSTIGGQNHNLAAGNRHAGEMDGSSHAIWSDAANLANFDPGDLARLRM